MRFPEIGRNSSLTWGLNFMSFLVKVDPSDLPRKHHSGWNWFNLIFPRGAQSPYKKMKNTRDITESVKFINLFCLKFFKNVWISSQSQYWKSNIILWMPKLLEYGPEGEVQEWKVPFCLKYGFLNKSFILNAPLVSCPFPVIRFGWVCCCTHPKRMTGNGQLTRGAFGINDLLRNPQFSTKKVLVFPKWNWISKTSVGNLEV